MINHLFILKKNKIHKLYKNQHIVLLNHIKNKNYKQNYPFKCYFVLYLILYKF